MIKKAILNSTLLNFFVKALNYGYYLLITLFIGYGIQTDSVVFIEGLVGFTILLPLQLLNMTLIPKLTNDINNFNRNFSTILFLSLIWSIFWVIIYKFFLIDIIGLFYPGLDRTYIDFISSNNVYVLVFIFLSLMTNIMSVSLDALKKHSLVYKILLIKSLSSIVLLYWFKGDNNVLFIVLSATVVIEFFILLYIYRKYFTYKFKIQFFLEQLKDIKYIILFASTGVLFGVIDRYYISFLDQSSITILKYSTLIIGMISGLVPISRILYPYLSQSTNKKQLDYFYKAMKIILMVYLPILVFIFIFPTFIPTILFGYGKVEDSQITQMGTLLFFLVPTAIFGILIGILDKILFLQKLYKALFYRLIATLIINGIGNYLSVFVFDWGLYGIVFFTMLVHAYILYSSYFIIKKSVK